MPSQDASALLAIIMLAVFVIGLPVLDAVSQHSGWWQVGWIADFLSAWSDVVSNLLTSVLLFRFGLGGAREWGKD